MNLRKTRISSKIKKMNLQQDCDITKFGDVPRLKFERELYMTPTSNKLIAQELSSPPTLCRQRRVNNSCCSKKNIQDRLIPSELFLPKFDDNSSGDGKHPFRLKKSRQMIEQAFLLPSNYTADDNSFKRLILMPNLE